MGMMHPVDGATNGVPDSFLSEWLKRNDKVISFATCKKGNKRFQRKVEMSHPLP
jgi:hypothetical protein